MAPVYGLPAAIRLCPGVRVVSCTRPHRSTDASDSSRLRQQTSVPLCVPSSLHSTAQLRSLSPAAALLTLLLPSLPRPPALDTSSPRAAVRTQYKRRHPPANHSRPEHAPVICAGACPRESPSCAIPPPTPPPPRPAIALRLHVHINVDLDLVALAHSLASRLDLSLSFGSLTHVLVRSFPKERRAFQSLTPPRCNQLAAPTASQCAAIALTISQSTLEALPRYQLRQRESKGKQAVLRGCWHTVQPGRLSTYGQTKFGSARAAG